MVDASGMIEGEDVLNGSKELLADKIKDCYSSNDYVIMELLNNDTIILVDCNNNFKYSKFDNLKSTGIDYSKFNHISIVSTDWLFIFSERNLLWINTTIL